MTDDPSTRASTAAGTAPARVRPAMTAGEFNTAMAHFYRGEVSRSNTWRSRLDATTNWAVVTTGAALTFARPRPDGGRRAPKRHRKDSTMTSNGTRVIATLKARPGREADLLAVLGELLEPTRAEPGCRLYELWRNREDAAELTFVEEWSSAEALAAHAASEHIARARSRYAELVVDAVDLRLYDRVG